MATQGMLEDYEEAEFGKVATIIGFAWTAAVLAAGTLLVVFSDVIATAL